VPNATRPARDGCSHREACGCGRLVALMMRAHAALGTELRTGLRGPRTHVTRLRSDPPLVLRTTVANGPQPWAQHVVGLAQVSLAAAAAGPVGGDHYGLDVHVGAGSALRLTEVSATLLLPGHDRARSRTDVRIRVDSGSTLIWLPEPIIAADRCDHMNDVQVELAPDARLLMREELVLGRHAEPTGRLRQRVRVRCGGQALYSQDLDVGTPAWASPGVASDSRAVGSVLLVDPTWRQRPPRPADLPGQAALMPLAGGAALVSALAEDNLALRRQLIAGLTALGPPWHPHTTPAR
jgi:urease accessory protein